MIKYLCSGRRGPLTPRAHCEPAGDLQNPKYPCRNAGAPGGNAADGVRRQRPDLHLHLPVHLQSLQQHADGAAAPPGQVRLGAAEGHSSVVIGSGFVLTQRPCLPVQLRERGRGRSRRWQTSELREQRRPQKVSRVSGCPPLSLLELSVAEVVLCPFFVSALWLLSCELGWTNVPKTSRNLRTTPASAG